jgi:hypothetical protein
LSPIVTVGLPVPGRAVVAVLELVPDVVEGKLVVLDAELAPGLPVVLDDEQPAEASATSMIRVAASPPTLRRR